MAAVTRIEQSADNTALQRAGDEVYGRTERGAAKRRQREGAALDKAQGSSLPLYLTGPQLSRRRRAKLRGTASRISGDHPVTKCLKAPKQDAAGYPYDVTVRTRGEGADARASFGGLLACKGVWCCADCSAKAAANNCAATSRVLTWSRGQGHTLAMYTLTVRHNGQSLRDTWDAVSSGMASITGGAGWAGEDEKHYAARLDAWNAAGFDYDQGKSKRAPRGWLTQTEPSRRIGLVEKFGVQGFIKAVECTLGLVGKRGNWHVHVHLAVLLAVPRSEARTKAVELGDQIFERWRAGIRRKGFDATRKGFDVRIEQGARSTLQEYLAKGVFGSLGEGLDALGKAAKGMAAEVTLGSLKKAGSGNRHPFELLSDLNRLETRGMLSTDAGRRDLALWTEWVTESRRRRQLQFSDSLKPIARQLSLDEQEKEEEQESTVVLVIPASQWALVLAKGDTAGADLLAVVENEGVSAALTWLRAIGVTARVPDKPAFL